MFTTKYFFTLLQLLLLCSCVKDAQELQQQGRIAYYQSDSSATRIVMGIYARMADGSASSYRTALLTGVSGDELTVFTKAELSDLYRNKMQPDNIYAYWYWKDAYACIYMANDVLDGCGQSSVLTPAVKSQLMGEAYFIRAYEYFYLVNLFGSVPVSTSIDVSENAKLRRERITAVYEQIVADLKKACDLLHDGYAASNSLPGSQERTRPNKATAAALLARVYLYSQKYPEAASLASSLIESKDRYELVSPEHVFLKNSREAIWQLMPSSPNYLNLNTHEGREFILIYPPRLTTQVALAADYVNSFDHQDIRKSLWIGRLNDSSVNPRVTYYYAYKYKVRSGTQLSEYTMIFRLAEQYLIRAEAMVYMGKVKEALADVDVLRRRAGLSPLAGIEPVISAEDALKVILKERQWELFTEGGHRWFDLRRTNNIDVIMPQACAAKETQWRTEKQLWPVPAEEIRRNANLTQNKGY
ncbi:RagB/SusD family nutrient uptake outer membrane protein [Chitinophaga rhizophila]|uniref:RagB/SusD family nutrient uptake outer membrane protein n=1 Tax=Chitinophaga rhizophila TaxID=2866212 RepID=A0ABS7G608_9BACT|nr:RagB/SusD family nutrient uptake outer membrane protein [Chitinophaga rhizophila]MBW8683080.1 RagB/SusD family nutrient uptake outer membrane protein [Chitinophaga rhizophila]